MDREINFLKICENNNNIIAFIEDILDCDNLEVKKSIISQMNTIIDYYKCSHDESYFKKLRINSKYEEGYILFLNDNIKMIKEEFYFEYDKESLIKVENLLKKHEAKLKRAKIILFIKIFIILIPSILSLLIVFIFNIFNIYELYIKAVLTLLLILGLDPFKEINILKKK